MCGPLMMSHRISAMSKPIHTRLMANPIQGNCRCCSCRIHAVTAKPTPNIGVKGTSQIAKKRQNEESELYKIQIRTPIRSAPTKGVAIDSAPHLPGRLAAGICATGCIIAISF